MSDRDADAPHWLRWLGPPGGRVDRRWQQLRAALEQPGPVDALPGSVRIWLSVFFTLRALGTTEVTVRAASTTYTFIFSLVPLLATTLAFIASVPGLVDERAMLEAALFEYFLPGAARSVQSYIEQFAEQAATAGAVSSLVFFAITLLLLQSVEESFNVIWAVRHPRTWRKRLEVLSVGFIFVILASLALVTLVGLAAGVQLPGLLLPHAGWSALATEVGLFLMQLFVTWLAFALANHTLPNADVAWRSALTGSVLAGSVWHLLKDGFTWYVTNFTSYENLYGALGTVPVFLLWVYLSFFLLFLGGSIAYTHQNLDNLIEQERMRRGENYPLAYFALAVVAVLAERFRDRTTEPRMSVEELAEMLRVEPPLVDRVLTPMVARRIVMEVDQDGRRRYALGVPADALNVGEVVRAAVGDAFEVPEVGLEGQLTLHRQIAELFGTARVSRDAVLDVMTVEELGRVVVAPTLAGAPAAPPPAAPPPADAPPAGSN